MYTITKEFHFSASHRLEGLPEDHPCSRLHGHNYLIKVECSNTVVNGTGFVIDYRELQPIKDYIDNTLDHQHLNDVLRFQPSAENMAKFLYETFKEMVWQVSAVEVSETPKTNAKYEPTIN